MQCCAEREFAIPTRKLRRSHVLPPQMFVSAKETVAYLVFSHSVSSLRMMCEVRVRCSLSQQRFRPVAMEREKSGVRKHPRAADN